MAETDATTPGRRAKKGVGMSQNKSEENTVRATEEVEKIAMDAMTEE